MNYRRIPANPEGRCTCGWCGCRTFSPPPPPRKYAPLPQLLKQEGRQREADRLQDHLEKFGRYE